MGHRSIWIAVMVLLAAAGCAGEAADHAPHDSDAGTPVNLAELIRQAKDDRAAYCSDEIERVCALQSPRTCTLAEALATECKRRPQLQLPRNDCGGTTLWSQSALGGSRWYYDENGKLIGAHLYSETNEYCGEFHVEYGVTCETTEQMASPCAKTIQPRTQP